MTIDFDSLIAQRLHNEALSLCRFCGKEKQAGFQLCVDCDYSTKKRDFEIQSYRAKRTPNPYKDVFDRTEDLEESDGQMVLIPNGETMAQRFEGTARYWEMMADWTEGPRSREAAEDARIYRHLAQHMRDYHEKVKRLSK